MVGKGCSVLVVGAGAVRVVIEVAGERTGKRI